MESTVYWIPVLQVLEARGFDVVLVNARHARSAPGRKSDVADCEWLRYLHSVGLLRGSFRPPDEICALRRHRDTPVKTASRSVLHMQSPADLASPSIKASRLTLIKALSGDWRRQPSAPGPRVGSVLTVDVCRQQRLKTKETVTC